MHMGTSICGCNYRRKKATEHDLVARSDEEYKNLTKEERRETKLQKKNQRRKDRSSSSIYIVLVVRQALTKNTKIYRKMRKERGKRRKKI